MIEIKRKANCCGCSACKSICPRKAISLVCDNEGFSYPVVNDELCIKCGLCLASCPISYRDSHKVGNTPLQVFAAHSRDEKIWFTSSSGGIFMALATHVIEKGGTVFGAIYDKNFKVEHARISVKNELNKFQGSKYVQSDIDGIFHQVKIDLSNGKLVLFSGTPCQVEGLNLFLQKPFANLITCDIICHCVPSPKVFADYIAYLQEKYKSCITEINMKDKTLGWGRQSLRIRFENGEDLFNTPDSNLWNNLFYSRLISRPSCYECRFTNVNRPGDLTIGDFWGIEKTHPELYDKKGVSLIYVNTQKGKDVMENISGTLKLTECRLEESIQDNLERPITNNPKRELFWYDYHHSSLEKIVPKYFRNNRNIMFKRLIKRVIRLAKM